MIFDKEGNTTIVLQENASLATFLNNLKSAYDKLQHDHLIINLFSFAKLSPDDVLEFLELSNTHRARKKSFVLVSNKVSFEEIPDEICLVPTLQEAKDIIEMEEIERDLDL
ncbi:ribonuclease Z [Flavobacterium sp. ASW18X]|uniref:ribonuclease Z n=1 Tax=Flavobacterium sp. ASW18X TaxID=2572595 RepID=UPI0010ADB5B5|nr:ribonuclease Z [Flavobacterium sp. ASW18X]TKD63437.1 ribonuclease Z [Flavobacterium sp. ASW18X]